MFIRPSIDPVAFKIFGFPVRWYGITYLLSFILMLLFGRIKTSSNKYWSLLTAEKLDDLLFYSVIGTIIGGRVGNVLLYDPVYYFNNPIDIFRIWNGGMSYHGGLTGVIIAFYAFSYKYDLEYFYISDFVATLAPIGYFFVRIGNFINNELPGVVTTMPWAVKESVLETTGRHPSQLYQAVFGGLIPFLFMYIYFWKPRPLMQATGSFLLLTGLMRFITEYFRMPDYTYYITSSIYMNSGQMMSIPVVIIGLLFIGLSIKNPCYHTSSS